jgi:hypothetical protein
LLDPLGLITPFIIQGKLLMRMLCVENNVSAQRNGQEQGGWHAHINDEMREKWIQFFNDMFDIERLEFPKCVKSEAADENPVLIVFSDGIKHAYGACAYIRWKTTKDTYVSNLIVAKNRIAPTRQLSIPRLELCGALLGTRLRDHLIKNMNFELDQVFHIVDSTIVQAHIQKESYGFGRFTATRVAEIQSKTKPEE